MHRELVEPEKNAVRSYTRFTLCLVVEKRPQRDRLVERREAERVLFVYWLHLKLYKPNVLLQHTCACAPLFLVNKVQVWCAT